MADLVPDLGKEHEKRHLSREPKEMGSAQVLLGQAGLGEGGRGSGVRGGRMGRSWQQQQWP